MLTLDTLLAALANCNLHLCLYAAFGIILMLRTVLCPPENPGEARELFIHGIVYVLLGLLK